MHGTPSPPLGYALTAARRLAVPVRTERVGLDALLGRILACDVPARADLPSGDASLMDGWAVRAADLDRPVRVVGESRAGIPFAGNLGRGEAVRISTGALLPPGADTIVRLEDGRDDGGGLVARTLSSRAAHVRPRGEDLRAGRPVLRAGTRLNGPRVGAVAAAGHAGVLCRVPPTVAVVTTGTELMEPGGPVGQGTVFDANRHGLRAQLAEAGGQVVSHVAVPDEAAGIRAALGSAVAQVDLVVVAGGLSVGRHDHVRAVLHEMGMRPAFSRLAMRPGRPTTLGTIGACRVLAVPGNPAAAAVGLHLLGRALLGTDLPWQDLPLATAVMSAPRLDEIIRCRVVGAHADPLPIQASGSIASLAGADVLAWLPWGRRAFAAGDLVRVSRL
jgi:molybdopterin molybdotransferase